MGVPSSPTPLTGIQSFRGAPTMVVLSGNGIVPPRRATGCRRRHAAVLPGTAFWDILNPINQITPHRKSGGSSEVRWIVVRKGRGPGVA